MTDSYVKEVCFLIDRNGEVLWSDTNHNPGYLEDRRDRWEAIWEHRERLAVIAHSHPCGPSAFSDTDKSTALAIRAALADDVYFAVVAPECTILRKAFRLEPHTCWGCDDTGSEVTVEGVVDCDVCDGKKVLPPLFVLQKEQILHPFLEPVWVHALRAASGMKFPVFNKEK